MYTHRNGHSIGPSNIIHSTECYNPKSVRKEQMEDIVASQIRKGVIRRNMYTHIPLKYDRIYPHLKCPLTFQWIVVCTCFVSFPRFNLRTDILVSLSYLLSYDIAEIAEPVMYAHTLLVVNLVQKEKNVVGSDVQCRSR